MLQNVIELIGAPDRPPAAVNMEIDTARRCRRDHAQVKLAGRTLDRDRLGAWRFRRQRKRADPLQAARAYLLNGQAFGLGIEPAHDLVVDRAGFGRNRGRVEQRGIDQERGHMSVG